MTMMTSHSERLTARNRFCEGCSGFGFESDNGRSLYCTKWEKVISNGVTACSRRDGNGQEEKKNDIQRTDGGPEQC